MTRLTPVQPVHITQEANFARDNTLELILIEIYRDQVGQQPNFRRDLAVETIFRKIKQFKLRQQPDLSWHGTREKI